MARLRSNLPSTSTRSDFGPVPLRGLSLVIGAIQTRAPSCGVRQAGPPTWKEVYVNPGCCRPQERCRTSCFQPTLRRKAPVRIHLPIFGRNHLTCTWDSCSGIVRASDDEAAQVPLDLDDNVPHQCLVYSAWTRDTNQGRIECDLPFHRRLCLVRLQGHPRFHLVTRPQVGETDAMRFRSPRKKS